MDPLCPTRMEFSCFLFLTKANGHGSHGERMKSVTYIMSKLFHLRIRITLDNRIDLHGLHVYGLLGYKKKLVNCFCKQKGGRKSFKTSSCCFLVPASRLSLWKPKYLQSLESCLTEQFFLGWMEAKNMFISSTKKRALRREETVFDVNKIFFFFVLVIVAKASRRKTNF